MKNQTAELAALNCSFELRESRVDEDSATGQKTGHFVGMASVFNVPDLEGDVIAPGAFTKSLQERGGVVPLLWQHDRREPVGLVKLEETSHGLQANGEIDLEIAEGKRAFSAATRRYVRGLSIGFDTLKDEIDREKNVRRLTEIRLWEVSLVTFPAQPLAQVTATKAMAVLSQLKSADELRVMSERMSALNEAVAGGQEMDPEQIEELKRLVGSLNGLMGAISPGTSEGDPTADGQTDDDAGAAGGQVEPEILHSLRTVLEGTKALANELR